MTEFFDGKVVPNAPLEANPRRYEILGLEDCEPNMGVPSISGQVLSSDTAGNREWISSGAGQKGEPGSPGPKGDKGDTGVKGNTGTSVTIIGSLALTPGNEQIELNAAFPGAIAGSGVIDSNTGHLWVTDGIGVWTDVGQIQGPTGQKGVAGTKGDKGDTGIQGPKGSSGPKGDKGDKGDVGIKGDKGDIGQKGDTGTLGAKGDKGNKGDTGSKGDTGAKGDTGTKGDKGEIGVKGDTGNAGTVGNTGGTPYNFSTSTLDSDPGTGFVRYNSAAISSVGFIYIDNLDANSNSQTAWYDTWDDSTDSIKGYLTLRGGASTSSVINTFRITGAVITAAGYYKIPVAYVSGSLPANNDGLAVQFSRTGDKGQKGDIGTKGDKGDTGAKGDKGDAGAKGDKGDVGQKGDLGLKGDSGNAGQVGNTGGTPYNFSTTVTDADPGNGFIRYNNAVIGSVTQIFIDNVDANLNTQTAWYDTWDDSTDPTKGFLVLRGSANTSTVVNTFRITGLVTVAAGYYKIPVAFVSGSLPANNDGLAVQFSRTGDKGQKGELGVKGDTGAKGDKGDIGGKGDIGAKGDKGEIGVKGSDGTAGSVGATGGTPYNFSTTTIDGDPGAGFIRYNNAAIGSVTQLFIDDLDANSNNQTAWYSTWDDSTDPTEGFLTIRGASSTSTVVNTFRITGLVTVAAGYYKIPVAYVSGTLPANLVGLAVMFSRTGDKGATGAKGDTGTKGDKGDSGGAGIKGDSGAKGDTGSKGDTGASVKGDKGDKGDLGGKGDLGPKGDKGDNANLQYWTVGQSITAPNATVPISFFEALGAYTNIDAALISKGNGATLAQLSDATAVAGNKRGTFATDFQKTRSAAAMVASGAYAGIVAGINNTSSGTASFVGAGGTNIASGTYSSVVGGNQGTASGNFSAILGGSVVTASGAYSATSGGYSHTANADYSYVAGGAHGVTRNVVGYQVFPACFEPISTTDGATQAGLLLLGRQTTDATQTTLASNASVAGTTNQLVLPNNSAYFVRGSVIAAVTGGGNTKAWEFVACVKRGATAASVTLVDWAYNIVAANAGTTAWTLVVDTDTTNGAMRVRVTGAAATTIRWVCKLETTEVTF